MKSWGSDAKEEAEAARVKAQSLLKRLVPALMATTGCSRRRWMRARQRAMRWAVRDTYVRNKPWHSVGAAAAVGVFIGVLLNLRR